jgi:hypothetical protein
MSASAIAAANPGIIPRNILETRKSIMASTQNRHHSVTRITVSSSARIRNINIGAGIQMAVTSLQHSHRACYCRGIIWPELSVEKENFVAEILALCDDSPLRHC